MSQSNNIRPASGSGTVSVIFAAYAEDQEGLRSIFFLAESIREFAGPFSTAPIWLYVPEGLTLVDTQWAGKFRDLRVEIKTSRTPEAARRFYFAGKVFAAGQAESDAQGKAAVLVWMDEDTVILRPPDAFNLPDGICLAYRPVMHNRSGSLYGVPPSAFWGRIYDKLALDDSQLFSMVTVADKQTIRAYFNAGLLVVRPERGILRAWPVCFTTLYSDSILADMCDKDEEKKIFLHQTALVGAVLNNAARKELKELSEQYNYPIFFHQQYESKAPFDDIGDIISLRYDVYFRNPDPQWSQKLKGPTQVVSWLKTRLGLQPK